jgi:cytosine/uracil/thiamine/allantoin permease
MDRETIKIVFGIAAIVVWIAAFVLLIWRWTEIDGDRP